MTWRHNNGATVSAQKLRFPIMLIVACSYNENHMEATLFSEFWCSMLTLLMRIVCIVWQNCVMSCLHFLSIKPVSDLTVCVVTTLGSVKGL